MCPHAQGVDFRPEMGDSRCMQARWRAMDRVALLALFCAGCASGEVNGDAGAGTVEGQPCVSPDDCAAPYYCLIDLNLQFRCLSSCSDPAQCPTGVCQVMPPATMGYCEPPAPPPDGGVPPVLRNDGNPCVGDAECAGGTCFTEAAGYPGGYCTTLNCTAHTDCAGSDVACMSGQPNRCVQLCEPAEGCREGYTCMAVPGANVAVCVPGG